MSSSYICATLNGIPAVDGQTIKLEVDIKEEVKYRGGILRSMEAPSFILVVTWTDASGNECTATETPESATDDDDGDEEEDAD